jgi:hypothetical protein
LGWKHHLGDLCADGRIILILKRNAMFVWTGFIWLRRGTIAGYCEYGNEPSGSKKARNLLSQLSNYKFVMEDSDQQKPIAIQKAEVHKIQAMIKCLLWFSH